jgi:hypothetical protein
MPQLRNIYNLISLHNEQLSPPSLAQRINQAVSRFRFPSDGA